VLQKAVPPAASQSASSPSPSTFGAAPRRKAEDADARQASYRQAWDSINSMVQVSLGAPSNSALCGEKRMDNLCLACSLL
jgi:hypothetical protein